MPINESLFQYQMISYTSIRRISNLTGLAICGRLQTTERVRLNKALDNLCLTFTCLGSWA